MKRSKVRAAFKKKAKRARKLVSRKPDSTMHKDGWARFDGVLRVRSLVGATLYIVYKLVYYAIGEWSAKREKLLETVDSLDKDEIESMASTLLSMSLMALILATFATAASAKLPRAIEVVYYFVMIDMTCNSAMRSKNDYDEN